MIRNRTHSHATADNYPGAHRHSEADSISDLNNRLNELSARLGQLNANARQPLQPRSRPADPSGTNLADISDTVDRLVSKLERRPAAHRGPGTQGVAESERLQSILSTLDGIDKRVRDISGNPVTETDTHHTRRDNSPDALQRAVDEITARQDSLDNRNGSRREPARSFADNPEPANSGVERHFRLLADKIDSLRQGDTEAAVERLRREVTNLRNEIGRRDTLGLSDDDAAMIRDLGYKVETLSAHPADSHAVEALRGEIADLRQCVIANNVEGTLHSLESGYQHIVERLDEMRRTVGDPQLLVRLADRIETIDAALKTIPQVEQINVLDQRINTLARQIDGLSMDMNDPAITQIERQLAELKSALGGVNPNDAIATLDAQLRALNDKIDGLERLGGETYALSQRLGAEAGNAQPEALLRISDQIDELRAAVSGDRHADRFRHLDASIAGLARKLDEIETMRMQDDGLAQLERRIDGVVARIEEIIPQSGNAGAFTALEARIGELAHKLDALGQLPHAAASGSYAELEETVRRIDGALQKATHSDALATLDDRITTLSAQIDGFGTNASDISEMADLRNEIAGMRTAFSKPIPVDMSRLERQITNLVDQVSSPRDAIDPSALAQLEGQIARIAQSLDNRDEDNETLTAIESALNNLYSRLDDNRDDAAEAARNAARDAVREFIGSRQEQNPAPDDGRIHALQQHLDQLKSTTQDSADRTQDTLVAVHDALQAIAGKLTNLEDARSTAPHHPSPSESGNGDRVDAPPAMTEVAEQRIAALTGGTHPVSEQTLRDDRYIDEAPVAHAPEPTVDTPEDTRPLEPGTGRPGQAAAMPGHIEPAAAEPTDPETNARDRKADFIAAARRAAQAAASDDAGGEGQEKSKRRGWFKRKRKTADEKPRQTPSVETGEDIYAAPLAGSQVSHTDDSTGGLAGVLKKHRRPLMIAATGLLVIILGAQLAKFVLSPTQETAALDQPIKAVPALEAPTDTGPEPVEAPVAETAETPSVDVPAPVSPPARAVDESESVDTDTTSSTGVTPGYAASDTAYPLSPAPTNAAAPASAASAPLPPEGVGPVALRQAAASGDPEAQFEVAARFTEGRGVAPNLRTAAEWYRRAAEAGLAPAQYRLGSLFEKGTGVRKDLNLARDWYQKAAAQGNSKAMHNLAVLYAEGFGGSPDFSTAGQWFDKAASMGVRDSQYNLGILYARGLGVPQDLKNSYKWFALAAKQGDGDAGKKRDEVANSLDRKGLAAARLAVETWQKTPVDPRANSVSQRNSWNAAPDRSAAAEPHQPTRQELIQKTQSMLAQLGYDPGPADGVPGPRTRDAVMDFQRKAGMPVTGEIDAALLKQLSKQMI